MDLRRLRYFVTVADEGNFTKAAARLNMAQPPLSRQVRQLEDECGAELFQRNARPVALTSAGRLLYEQAIQLLARVDDVRAMMRRVAATERRTFAIGFVASTIYARLPALIRGFREASPQVDLRLIELTSLDQIAALKEGRIDVGFGRIRFDDTAVKRIVLREERLVVAIPASHPLAEAAAPVSLRQLSVEPLILFPVSPRPSYADQVIGLFHDRGLETGVLHEVRELQIALGLVAAEEGLCIVPETVQRAQLEDVVYREIEEEVTSPIIMSHRVADRSLDLALLRKTIARIYSEWGYPVPAAIARDDEPA